MRGNWFIFLRFILLFRARKSVRRIGDFWWEWVGSLGFFFWKVVFVVDFRGLVAGIFFWGVSISSSTIYFGFLFFSRDGELISWDSSPTSLCRWVFLLFEIFANEWETMRLNSSLWMIIKSTRNMRIRKRILREENLELN